MSLTGGGNSGGGGGDERESRPVRDMQSLLRFCIQEGMSGDGQSGGQELAMDPERRQWLEEALKTMSVDLIQEMLQNIKIIHTSLQSLNTLSGEGESEEKVEEIVNAIDRLLDRIEDLDNASDFQKIGGFEILLPLLNSSVAEVQLKGAELVGELVQNHEPCQKAALDIGILKTLVSMLDDPQLKDKVKVKALYALSCLIRHYSKGQEEFENNLDGYSVILRMMQSRSPEGEKLRIKSAFLLGSIIQDRASVNELLFKMGFIEQLVGLLHMEHDTSHEHLLSALVNFLTDFQAGIEESKRPELQFKQLLTNRVNFLEGKPQFQEEESYAKQLLTLCFNNNTSNDQSEADR